MGVKLGLSITLTEEYRVRVLKNRVLRNIFGPKGDEETGNLYCTPQIKKNEVGGACMGDRTGAYRVVVERREENIPPGKLVIDGMMKIWIFKKWGSHGLG